jgi:hypothetical protein
LKDVRLQALRPFAADLIMDNNISKIPSLRDREYIRVDAELYFYCEPIEFDKGNKGDHVGMNVPTFAQEEDDLVGLSIDAFREQVLHENPPDKENLLKIQQLLSLTKRFLDAELLGREQKIFRKMEVNVSASGLSFPSDIAYHAGQQLRLDLFFPKFPFTYVSVMGEVVRSEKADIGYEIKLHFKDISEKTQNEIIKFVKNYQK